jgi:hypothetical protein
MVEPEPQTHFLFHSYLGGGKPAATRNRLKANTKKGMQVAYQAKINFETSLPWAHEVVQWAIPFTASF